MRSSTRGSSHSMQRGERMKTEQKTEHVYKKRSQLSAISRQATDYVILQSGDPDSRNAPKGKQLGEGGPGYTLPAEILYPQFYHKRGALAAAREGDNVNPERRSSGSQFYIVWGKTHTASQMAAENALMLENTDGLLEIPDDVCDTYEIDGGTPHLDGLFTVFGEVVEGLKTVRQIQRAKTDVYDRPVEDIKIIKATVIPPKTE